MTAICDLRVLSVWVNSTPGAVLSSFPVFVTRQSCQDVLSRMRVRKATTRFRVTTRRSSWHGTQSEGFSGGLSASASIQRWCAARAAMKSSREEVTSARMCFAHGRVQGCLKLIWIVDPFALGHMHRIVLRADRHVLYLERYVFVSRVKLLMMVEEGFARFGHIHGRDCVQLVVFLSCWLHCRQRVEGDADACRRDLGEEL